MTPEGAHDVLSSNSPIDFGRFYGAVDQAALGAGLIYEQVLSPHFSIEEKIFFTVKQAVYVLTHECDVDPANARPFNDSVCFCPVIPLPAFLRRYSARWPDDARISSFLTAVAKRDVGRVVYLPPGPNSLEFGGLVYLNSIGSTHVSSFDGLRPITALSQYGLRELDAAIEHSLLRPKDDRLAFAT